MKGKIFIPTMGRVDRQKTIDSIPKNLYEQVRFVCPLEEVKSLEKRYKVKALACNLKGIAKIRQWILENCGDPVCTMIDDDQWFFKRIGDTVKLTPMSLEEIETLLVEMEDLCQLYPMVGLSARQGNNHHEEKWFSIAGRIHNHYSLDVETLLRENVRFDRMLLMEDFYVNLSLLTKGYETVKIVDRCWNQSESNASGGCSSYRNQLMQKEASCLLAELFPDFVKVVEKKTKNGWFEEGVRYDVRVQWKKAMESGKANKKLMS